MNARDEEAVEEAETSVTVPQETSDDRAQVALFYRRLKLNLSIAGALIIVGLAVAIAAPLMIGLLWAAVIVLFTWPVYLKLLRLIKRPALSAALMSAGLLFVFVLFAVPAALELVRELRLAAVFLTTVSQSDMSGWKEYLESYPFLQPVAELTQQYMQGDPARRDQLLQSITGSLLGSAGNIARALVTGVVTALFCIFASFFFYRHGTALANQFYALAVKLWGEAGLEMLNTFIITMKAAIYGSVLTAITQGAVSTIGFLIFGAPVPFILGVITTFAALFPAGPALVYLPVSLYLFFAEHNTFAAVGVAVWGVAIVSVVDNIVRPIAISQTTRISLLLIVLGVIGGTIVFNSLLGVFLGPAVLAVFQSLWLKLVEDRPVRNMPNSDDLGR